MRSFFRIKYIFFLLLFSCNENNQEKTEKKESALEIYLRENTKVLDFGAFTIRTPENWYKVRLQGFDSYVGAIVIDSTDTVTFDIGWYSNDLPDDKNIYNINYEIIDGYKAKIVSPKLSGQGVVGIYIDSFRQTGFYNNGVWKYKNNIDAFNLYGENLLPKNEKLFLLVLRTLKFPKRKLKNGDTIDTSLNVNKVLD